MGSSCQTPCSCVDEINDLNDRIKRLESWICQLVNRDSQLRGAIQEQHPAAEIVELEELLNTDGTELTCSASCPPIGGTQAVAQAQADQRIISDVARLKTQVAELKEDAIVSISQNPDNLLIHSAVNSSNQEIPIGQD